MNGNLYGILLLPNGNSAPVHRRWQLQSGFLHRKCSAALSALFSFLISLRHAAISSHVKSWMHRQQLGPHSAHINPPGQTHCPPLLIYRLSLHDGHLIWAVWGVCTLDSARNLGDPQHSSITPRPPPPYPSSHPESQSAFILIQIARRHVALDYGNWGLHLFSFNSFWEAFNLNK